MVNSAQQCSFKRVSEPLKVYSFECDLCHYAYAFCCSSEILSCKPEKLEDHQWLQANAETAFQYAHGEKDREQAMQQNFDAVMGWVAAATLVSAVFKLLMHRRG